MRAGGTPPPMTKPLISLAALLALAVPAQAQDEASPPSPGEIVAQAPAGEWVAIAPEDLLVMTLAPAADGSTRKVVIQLIPAPFSQGWVENMRTLARAGWYDGITVNRVQDNYVVQWGDPNYDNPEADGPAKPLPEGLPRQQSQACPALTLRHSRATTKASVPPITPLNSKPQSLVAMWRSGPAIAPATTASIAARPRASASIRTK